LRLAPYINYCYPLSAHQYQPPLSASTTPSLSGSSLTAYTKNRWNWKCEGQSDWRYPWSTACLNIFRKKDIEVHINSINFKGPNSLESRFCDFTFPGQDFMICYESARAYCCANNLTQTESPNRQENTYSLEELNKQFLLGKRLNPNIYENRIIPSCHGGLEYIWM